MKWYKYLFFYCLVFFCFSCNVFGISVKDEKYPKDCDGNVITGLDQEPSTVNFSDNDSCSISASKQIKDVDSKKDNPQTCLGFKIEDKWYKRDVLLLIDNSWSMKGKEQQVRKIFKKVAAQLKSEENIYVKYFLGPEGEKKYSFSQVKTEKMRGKIARKILEYKDGDSTKPLRHGTNTYSSSALNKAATWVKTKVKDSEHIPIVIFITDGYPTAYKDTDENKYELGYLSSARHFYEFAVALKNLQNQFLTISKNGKNKLMNNSIVKPKFATIGLGISNDKTDMSAKYLLTTKRSDFDNLKNLTTSDKQHKEDKRFYQLLNGNISSEIELTLSIASNPDLGVVGYSSYNSNTETVKFKNFGNIDTTNGKKLAEDNGIAIGPIKKNLISQIKSNGRIINYTSVDLDGKYTGYSIIFLKKSDVWETLKKNKTISIHLKNSKALMKYKIKQSEIRSTLNGFIDYYKFSPTDVDLDDIISGLEVKSNVGNVSKENKDIDYKKRTYYGLNSDYKYLNLNGRGYVRHCSKEKLTKNDSECSAVFVNEIRVKYFINYSLFFNGGTLKTENKESYSPGLGFKFSGIDTVFHNSWYYASYVENNVSSSPVVEYKYSGNWYKINFDSIKKSQNMIGEPFMSRDDIWNKISSAVKVETSNFSVNYETVSSNDSTILSESINGKIERKKSNVETSSDGNGGTLYNISETDSIKKSCIKETNFEYVDEDENCPAEYAQTDSYAGEDFSYIEKNGRYYFIPFGYKQDTVDVTVELNVAGKELSTTCSIRVNDGGSPCEPTNSSEPKSIEDQVSYRSIDKDNPFPRANNKYYSIPINWRSWYCSSSGTSGNCISNTEKQKRLSNSYSNIYYSKKYSSQDLTNIAKQTLSDSKVYYSSWNNIVNTTGKSNSIGATNSDSTKIIEEKFGSTKSYCPLGSFKENCDQVMLK